jgi:hypothetical protein
MEDNRVDFLAENNRWRDDRGDVAPTFRACPERGEGSAHAELKFGATTRRQAPGQGICEKSPASGDVHDKTGS